MDDILDRFVHTSKLNEDQVNHLKSCLTPQEIEAAIKAPFLKKELRSQWFSHSPNTLSKNSWYQYFSNYYTKQKHKEDCHTNSMKLQLPGYLNHTKTHQRECQTNFLYEPWCKTTQKKIINRTQEHIKESIYYMPSRLHPRDAGLVQYIKILQHNSP